MSSPVHQPHSHCFVKCIIDALYKDDFQLITVLMISIHIPTVFMALKWCICSYNSLCFICSCHTLAHKHLLGISWSVLDPVPVWCDVMCDVMWCSLLTVVFRLLLPVSWFLMDPIPLWCDVWQCGVLFRRYLLLVLFKNVCIIYFSWCAAFS